MRKSKDGPRLCRAEGCQAHSKGFYSVYCNRHELNQRRHGHELQTAIGPTQLKPYLKMVDDRLRKNENTVRWDVIEDRWKIIVSHAREIVARTGAGFGWERRAAQTIIKVSDNVDYKEIVRIVVALYLLQRFDPRVFRDDRAFQFQLVRNVRKLTDISVGTYYNPSDGKVKRAYKTLPPKSVAIMGQWISQVLGSLALYFVKAEERDEEERQRKVAAFREPILEGTELL